MLRNWFPTPRWKRYAAQSGYLYEYVFEGVELAKPSALDYQFRVRPAADAQIVLRITVEKELLQPWIRGHRELDETECFGIAKLALQRAFDQAAEPGALISIVRVSRSDMESYCRELDF